MEQTSQDDFRFMPGIQGSLGAREPQMRVLE